MTPALHFNTNQSLIPTVESKPKGRKAKVQSTNSMPVPKSE
jgi:hypothetical protein